MPIGRKTPGSSVSAIAGREPSPRSGKISIFTRQDGFQLENEHVCWGFVIFWELLTVPCVQWQ